MTGVYVYSGNPFQPGPLPVSNVTLNKAPDGIPEHTQGRYYAASDLGGMLLTAVVSTLGLKYEFLEYLLSMRWLHKMTTIWMLQYVCSIQLLHVYLMASTNLQG